MSVTESYKTITFFSNEANFVRNMVSMRLEMNRAALMRAEVVHIREFLNREIVLCVEVLAALNGESRE